MSIGGNGSAPRIALIVDHPLRDLAGLVLVAQELCQRGAVCHLVPMNRQEPETWALRPDFVLLNFLRRKANEGFARSLVRAGIGFGLLDTEGGVWPSEADYAAVLWEDPALLRRTGCACMWGPRLARYVVEHGHLEAHQVRVTGCARFDLYHPKWRGVMDATDLGDARPRILINTNYYTANSRFVTAAENVAQLVTMGWTAARAQEMADTEAVGMKEIVQLAQQLSQRFPAAHVVVRPHPFESADTYRERLRAFAGVEVNESGAVQSQIGRASVVVQRSCTTAIEATLASVQALSPRWIPVASENPVSEDVSIPCESPEKLFATISGILEGRDVASPVLKERRREVIRDWFFETDGMAHARVADAIGERVGGPGEADAALCRRLLYGIENGGAPGRTPFGSRLRHALRLSPHWSFAKWGEVLPSPRPEKTFRVAEVEALVRRIADERARAGETVRPLTVALASESGGYSDGFRGHSVTLRVA